MRGASYAEYSASLFEESLCVPEAAREDDNLQNGESKPKRGNNDQCRKKRREVVARQDQIGKVTTTV